MCLLLVDWPCTCDIGPSLDSSVTCGTPGISKLRSDSLWRGRVPVGPVFGEVLREAGWFWPRIFWTGVMGEANAVDDNDHNKHIPHTLHCPVLWASLPLTWESHLIDPMTSVLTRGVGPTDD